MEAGEINFKEWIMTLFYITAYPKILAHPQNAQVYIVKLNTQRSLVVQWLRSWCSQSWVWAGSPGLISSQETRSHMPQLRVPMPQLKMLCVQLTPGTAK